MKSLSKISLMKISLALVAFTLCSIASSCGKPKAKMWTPWVASDENIFLGSVLYNEEGCKNCHGIAFDGKGPEAAASALPVPGFNIEIAPDKTQTTYFKAITKGTEKLPSHAYQSLTDSGRWALANFLFSQRKPYTGQGADEKTETQYKNVQAGLAEARAAYTAAFESKPVSKRRWDMGFQPIGEREPTPELNSLLKNANVKLDGSVGVVSEGRMNRPRVGAGAESYDANCMSCHGKFGEGRALPYGMGFIYTKNDAATDVIKRRVKATLVTKDLATSDAMDTVGAFKAAHQNGTQIHRNFDSFNEAEWSELYEFTKNLVQP